jgi:hypothetical protein
MEGAVPDIRDRRVGELERLRPVSAVVVRDPTLARRTRRLAHPGTPAMVDRDAVGRVGRQKRRPLAGHQQLDVGGFGRVAAQQAVRPKLVQLARL